MIKLDKNKLIFNLLKIDYITVDNAKNLVMALNNAIYKFESEQMAEQSKTENTISKMKDMEQLEEYILENGFAENGCLYFYLNSDRIKEIDELCQKYFNSDLDPYFKLDVFKKVYIIERGPIDFTTDSFKVGLQVADEHFYFNIMENHSFKNITLCFFRNVACSNNNYSVNFIDKKNSKIIISKF